MDGDTKKNTATIVHTVKPAGRPSAAPLQAAPQPESQSQSQSQSQPQSQPVAQPESNAPPKPEAKPLSAPDGSHLPRTLIEAVNQCVSRTNAIEKVVSVLGQHLEPALIDYLARDPSGSLQTPSNGQLLERLPPQSADKLRQWGTEACESGHATIHHLSGGHLWTIVNVPVMLRGRAPEVLCAVLRSKSADQQSVISSLQLAAANITLWDIANEERRARTESRNTAALLELMSALDNCDDLTTSYQILVNDLQRYLGCQRVALALTRSGNLDCRLVSVSGLPDFDHRSDFTVEIEAALDESILRDDITVVQSSDETHCQGSQAHQYLLASGRATTLISTPLRTSDNSPVGAWIIFDDRPELDVTATQDFMRTSQTVVGSRMDRLRRAQTDPMMRPINALMHTVKSRKFVSAVVACALVLAVMIIPVHYKIACDCQLEPVSRRFVAAPYAGTLQESLVESGQIVAQGQLLARMDARELRWEMSGLQADHASEQKNRDAAAARDEFALSQQSSLEMERLALKMKLIRHRLENLEIKSPINGIVIAGDLKKSEGAPLTIGQAMFEIGPLDQMIVEVAIPEREILYAGDQMEVEIRLDAAQHQTVTGTIARISPRSETRDNQSVYVAEVKLDNHDGTLRPGMKGSVKIISDPHPLGWNLLHRAWESFAMLVGV
jgi:RND family efflux transporter MFP subunit